MTSTRSEIGWSGVSVESLGAETRLDHIHPLEHLPIDRVVPIEALEASLVCHDVELAAGRELSGIVVAPGSDRAVDVSQAVVEFGCQVVG